MAREGVGERRVKLQDPEQSFSLDDVQVTVGQSPDVCTGTSQSGLFPKHVPKHVSFSWMGLYSVICLVLSLYSFKFVSEKKSWFTKNRDDLVVLDNFERT